MSSGTHCERLWSLGLTTGAGQTFGVEFAGRGRINAHLSKWPLPQPCIWADLVNQPQTEGELAAIRRSVTRGQPYGNDDWVNKTTT